MLQPSCSAALVRYLSVPSHWWSMTCRLTLSPCSPCSLHCSASKRNRASGFPGAAWFTLLFWGRQVLYLGVRSVPQKEPYAILPAQGYWQVYHCLFIFSFTLQTKLGSCTGLPTTFILHWNLICPLGHLHATLVQLEDKYTMKIREVDTEGSIKDLYETSSAIA